MSSQRSRFQGQRWHDIYINTELYFHSTHCIHRWILGNIAPLWWHVYYHVTEAYAHLIILSWISLIRTPNGNPNNTSWPIRVKNYTALLYKAMHWLLFCKSPVAVQWSRHFLFLLFLLFLFHQWMLQLAFHLTLAAKNFLEGVLVFVYKLHHLHHIRWEAVCALCHRSRVFTLIDSHQQCNNLLQIYMTLNFSQICRILGHAHIYLHFCFSYFNTVCTVGLDLKYLDLSPLFCQ